MPTTTVRARALLALAASALLLAPATAAATASPDGAEAPISETPASEGAEAVAPFLISSDSAGAPLAGESVGGIDTDAPGTFMVFVRRIGGRDHVMVKNRATKQVINLTNGANGNSASPSINNDASLVAFSSEASNLVANDTNGVSDVFVWRRATGAVVRVSVGPGGQQSNGASHSPQLAKSQPRVVFASRATNLVGNDAGAQQDLYIRDLGTQRTILVSVSQNGQGGNADSYFGTIDGSGNWVAFMSTASNLLGGGGLGLYLREVGGVSPKTSRFPMQTLAVPCPGGAASVKERLAPIQPQVAGTSVAFVVTRTICVGNVRATADVMVFGIPQVRHDLAAFTTWTSGGCTRSTRIVGGLTAAVGQQGAVQTLTADRGSCSAPDSVTLWRTSIARAPQSVFSCTVGQGGCTAAPAAAQLNSAATVVVFNTGRAVVAADTNGVTDSYRMALPSPF